MEIFQITKSFPKEETYSLTSQIRRSSRSVCANLAEAFRKRRYEKAFISKLSDSEGEAAETQVWLDYSLECSYLKVTYYNNLFADYEKIIGMRGYSKKCVKVKLVKMNNFDYGKEKTRATSSDRGAHSRSKKA
jgi:four helix bundle protein